MKNIFFLSLFIVALLLTACSVPGLGAQPTITPCPTVAASSAAACPLPTRTPPALPSGALFQVLLSDGKSIPFTAADLKKLPPAQASLDGKTVEAWRLLDVLSAAGAAEYSQVILNGETTAILKKEQVDAQTMLVVGSSARLVAPALPADQQINGITTIRTK